MIKIDKLKEYFKRDGYIFIPGFLNETEVKQIEDKIKEYIIHVVPKMSSSHVFYEDKSDKNSLKQLQDLQIYDPFFSEILYNSRFEEIAKMLLEVKVIGKTIEYFNKPPKIGKPTPPHQDGYYFNLKPPQAITMWMALENVDLENGCLRYIPGSHLTGMRQHGRSQTIGFSQGITDYNDQDRMNEEVFPVKPGDLLIHHSLTIHRADGNKSNTRSRKAIGLIYFDHAAKEDIRTKEAYQKMLKAGPAELEN